MPAAAKPGESLFSYGTLQLDAVQLATFGRKLAGTPDLLPGYALEKLAIDDPATVALSGKSQHTIATFTGRDSDAIPGTVYALTADELASADKYEVKEYRRVAVILRSGARAWVYVDARQAAPSEKQ